MPQLPLRVLVNSVHRAQSIKHIPTVALFGLRASLGETAPEPGKCPLTAYAFDLTINQVRYRMERYDDQTQQALDQACIPNPLG
jgi:hypothetical protein